MILRAVEDEALLCTVNYSTTQLLYRLCRRASRVFPIFFIKVKIGHLSTIMLQSERIHEWNDKDYDNFTSNGRIEKTCNSNYLRKKHF